MSEENKIISVSKYDEVINSPLFMSAGWLVPTHAYMCGYCRETKGNMIVSRCSHCGASLKEGYRFVGKFMDGDFLFVKEYELLNRTQQNFAADGGDSAPSQAVSKPNPFSRLWALFKPARVRR